MQQNWTLFAEESLCELSLKFVKNNHQIMDVQLEDDQFPEDIKPSLNIAADFGAA